MFVDAYKFISPEEQWQILDPNSNSKIGSP